MVRNERVYILHLSDLHLAEKLPEDSDDKVPVKKSLDSEKMDQFKECLKELLVKPDYVVVSGDITTNGAEYGFNLFNSIIEEMIKQDKLPSLNNFIVVPGNHDVMKGESIRDKSRWRNFKESMGKDYLIPWIAGVDPVYDEMKILVDEALNGDTSVLGRSVKAPKTGRIFNLPFLLDRDKKVIFYVFNSSILSHTTLDDKASKEMISQVRQYSSQEQQIMKLAEYLEKKLEIDPARIVRDEIKLFVYCIKRMKEILSDEYDDFLKIAVLHHQITPIVCSEEVKSFEMLMNAGYFKKVLVKQGFQVVFHGHKHWNEIYRDTAISGGGELLVISGGTVFGGTDREKRAGFYFLEFATKKKTVTPFYYKIDNSLDTMPDEEKEISYVPAQLAAREILVDKGQEVDLKKFFLRIEQTLLQNVLQYEDKGRKVMGWGKIYTRDKERRIGRMAIAYGLIIADMLNINTAAYMEQRTEIIETLWRYRLDEGCFRALSQNKQPAIEATICALRAFACVGDMDKKKAVLQELENILQQEPLSEESSITTLTLVMDVLHEFCPKSRWIDEIKKIILKKAYRSENGTLLYWPISGEIDTENSVIWTALAVISLMNDAKIRGHLEEEREKLKDCGKWLLKKEWHNCQEDIRRWTAGTYEKLNYRHFTAPWCVVALLRLGYGINEPRLAEEMKSILKMGENGYWPWGGELDYPIWTIYDALTAIREFALSGMKL